RRVAILMPDYPGAAGRTGYAVGLDVPASVLAMLHDLNDAGYRVERIPESPRALLDLIERGSEGLALKEYQALFGALPAVSREKVQAAWGEASKETPSILLGTRSTLPPSVAASGDISPSRGEIGSQSPTSAIGSNLNESAISPLEGEM